MRILKWHERSVPRKRKPKQKERERENLVGSARVQDKRQILKSRR